MSYLTADHTDVLTYWAPDGFDYQGLPGFAAPVSLMGRWRDKAKLFRGPDGRDLTSESVVLVGEDLKIGGKLLLGESMVATPPAEAKEIRGWEKTQEIAGTGYQRRVYL